MIRDFYLQIKWAWQRVFRGYDDTAYWDLCEYIMCIALPVLQYIKKEQGGLPYDKEKKRVLTQEEWDNILDKMIAAFTLYEESLTIHGMIDDTLETEEAKQKGFELFGKWLRSLWT